MRSLGLLLTLGLVIVVPGCKWAFLRNNNTNEEPVARTSGGTPAAAQLVERLKVNSQAINSIQCRDVDLDCKQGMQPIGLMGRLTCQKQRDFNLTGTVGGKSVVLIGSNQQEFWYWIGKADPPWLFHCSYNDLNAGNAQLPFPFQPEWIMEALGMGTYGPPENYKVVPKGRGQYELIQELVDGQGRKVRKVTVFDNRLVVTEHILRDANNNPICIAHINDWHNKGGVVVPRKIAFEWPSEKLSLTIKMTDVEINKGIHPEVQARLFTRPNLADVQTYDLARGPDSPAGVRRAGGVQNR